MHESRVVEQLSCTPQRANLSPLMVHTENQAMSSCSLVYIYDFEYINKTTHYQPPTQGKKKTERKKGPEK